MHNAFIEVAVWGESWFAGVLYLWFGIAFDEQLWARFTWSLQHVTDHNVRT